MMVKLFCRELLGRFRSIYLARRLVLRCVRHAWRRLVVDTGRFDVELAETAIKLLLLGELSWLLDELGHTCSGKADSGVSVTCI